jgi:hypothetical protein
MRIQGVAGAALPGRRRQGWIRTRAPGSLDFRFHGWRFARRAHAHAHAHAQAERRSGGRRWTIFTRVLGTRVPSLCDFDFDQFLPAPPFPAPYVPSTLSLSLSLTLSHSNSLLLGRSGFHQDFTRIFRSGDFLFLHSGTFLDCGFAFSVRTPTSRSRSSPRPHRYVSAPITTWPHAVAPRRPLRTRCPGKFIRRSW